MPSSWLATWLDLEYLVSERGASILPPLQIEKSTVFEEAVLPPKRLGVDVAAELGGRKLLRYLTEDQLGMFRYGSPAACYATPTPYAPEEVQAWLLLPAPATPRKHVLILEPAAVPLIQGPLWVAGARGIQYILPDGFPEGAIIVPGAPGAHWEIEVT